MQAESRSLASQVSKLTAQMASNEKAEARRGEGAVRLQVRPARHCDARSDHMLGLPAAALASPVHTSCIAGLQQAQRRIKSRAAPHMRSPECLNANTFFVYRSAQMSREQVLPRSVAWLQARVARLEEMLEEAQGKRRDDERARVRPYIWMHLCCLQFVVTALATVSVLSA